MRTWRDWQVLRLLGQGGNGTAYLVARGGQQAVLKLPASHVTPADHQQECRNLYLAANLGVAPAPIETSPDGILMAYLPPPTAMPMRERVRLLLGNLNRLHTRGFVHRDVKPENVVGVHVIDLGALVDTLRDRDVEPVGTPGYAPPEQYQGVISPLLDAYGAGWVIVTWLGGPQPDPASFGYPSVWRAPDDWQAFLSALLDPDPRQRMGCGLGFHLLTGSWCTLTGGVQVASDLVSVQAWRQTLPDAPYQAHQGYVTNLAAGDVARYLAATGTRLPTLAELQAVAVGTELARATRSADAAIRDGLVSDLGARNTRRMLWQPTQDGVLFGGTAYADAETLPAPHEPNAMIGLRVAR